MNQLGALLQDISASKEAEPVPILETPSKSNAIGHCVCISMRTEFAFDLVWALFPKYPEQTVSQTHR